MQRPFRHCGCKTFQSDRSGNAGPCSRVTSIVTMNECSETWARLSVWRQVGIRRPMTIFGTAGLRRDAWQRQNLW